MVILELIHANQLGVLAWYLSLVPAGLPPLGHAKQWLLSLGFKDLKRADLAVRGARGLRSGVRVGRPVLSLGVHLGMTAYADTGSAKCALSCTARNG